MGLSSLRSSKDDLILLFGCREGSRVRAKAVYDDPNCIPSEEDEEEERGARAPDQFPRAICVLTERVWPEIARGAGPP